MMMSKLDKQSKRNVVLFTVTYKSALGEKDFSSKTFACMDGGDRNKVKITTQYKTNLIQEECHTSVPNI